METQGLQQLPRIVHKIGEEMKQSQVFLYNFIAKPKMTEHFMLQNQVHSECLLPFPLDFSDLLQTWLVDSLD